MVTASSGTAYVALRPLLADYTLAMKRGATIVYPKDAAQILAYADVFPGARVLEAGAGSGALSCWLLRAIGPDGELVSFEARPDFAEIARENVRKYFGEVPAVVAAGPRRIVRASRPRPVTPNGCGLLPPAPRIPRSRAESRRRAGHL